MGCKKGSDRHQSDIIDRNIAKDTDRGKRSECKAGETTMIECNHCLCAGVGWLCTMIACGKGSDRTGIARRLKESEPCRGRNDTCNFTYQCCQIGWGAAEQVGCCRLGEDGIGRCHYVPCFGCWWSEDICEACRARACGK